MVFRWVSGIGAVICFFGALSTAEAKTEQAIGYGLAFILFGILYKLCDIHEAVVHFNNGVGIGLNALLRK